MKNLILILILIVLSGCATPIDMVATGGSKSDGIIEMSYEYTEFEIPVVSDEQGLEVATKRCKAWGYKKADPFDGGIEKCVLSDGLGCSRMRTTISYQCI